MWRQIKNELRTFWGDVGVGLIYFLAVPAVFWSMWDVITGNIPHGSCIVDGWCPSRSWDMVAAPLILLIFYLWSRANYRIEDFLPYTTNDWKYKVITYETVSVGWFLGLVGGIFFFLIPTGGWWVLLRILVILILGLCVVAISAFDAFVEDLQLTWEAIPTKGERVAICLALIFGVAGGLLTGRGVSEKGLVWAIAPFTIFLVVESLLIFVVYNVNASRDSGSVQTVKT